MLGDTPPVICVEHLRKSYGTTIAVEDVSFEVFDGEIFGIIGPNGAGKTTAVECLQGLRRADKGEIRVLRLDPHSQLVQLRRYIGAQLQASSLPDRIKVWEALDLFASYASRPVDWRGVLHQWGLAELRDRSFGDLSGGQKQRLFLALAFVNEPQLVFLDELTQGLDPQARRMTWKLVQDIRKQGTTIVLVTHSMSEAEYLCDRVAIVDRGKVVMLDSPQAIVDSLHVPLRVRFSAELADLSWIEAMPVVQRVERRGSQIEIEGTGPVLALVAAALVERGLLPTDLRTERPTLEDAFIALTGREIGD
jgi:ABC-2 type transport system ATP-binding protein